MAIYSAQLAAVNCPADSLTLIYTVPPASGPAIVKQVGLKVEAGNVYGLPKALKDCVSLAMVTWKHADTGATETLEATAERA